MLTSKFYLVVYSKFLGYKKMSLFGLAFLPHDFFLPSHFTLNIKPTNQIASTKDVNILASIKGVRNCN